MDTCPQCDAEVSSDQSSCQKCGCDMSEDATQTSCRRRTFVAVALLVALSASWLAYRVIVVHG